MADPPKTTALPVVTPSGKAGYLPAEFADSPAAEGVRRATPQEMAREQALANENARGDALRTQFEKGGFVSALEGEYAPQAAGLARGFTMGLSDEAILRAASLLGGDGARESVRKRLGDYQEYAPGESAFGEVGGMIAGSVAGQGPAGWASRGGRVLESGIVRGIGAESAGARIAGKVLGGAASGALENSIYEAGKTASDAAIHDEPLTGEKLVAGATHGALFGGAMGGAFGGLAALAGEASTSLGRATKSLAEVSAEGGEPAAKGTIADLLEKNADVKTIKALGGSAGDLRALEANVPGGFRRVAQDIRTDLEATTGKSIGHHTRESLHEYATARVETLGEDLGKMLSKLDEAKTGIAPDPAAFVAKVREELIAPNMITKADGTSVAMPGQEKTVKALQKWVGSVEDAFADRAPTFTEWQKIRRNLDGELKFQSAKVSPTVDSLRQMRGIMEGELISSGEAAANEAGGRFAEQYQATKSLYQSVKKASELTTRGVSRDLVNNSMGLTSRMAGIAGASVGTALGGPVGGFLGGGLGGLLGKAVQSHGDVLAADLLSRAATLAGVTKVTGRVTSELESGVRTLIPAKGAAEPRLPAASRARAPMGVSVTGDLRGDFRRIASVVASAVASPVATTERVARSIGSLGDHAPATAAAAIQTTLSGLSFLHSKLPPSRQDQYSLQPQLQPETRASDAEVSRFMRYSQAVDDPLIVLREAKTNTLTRDHVEAVQAVYPKLYDEIRGSVMRQLVESKSPLPYARRIQLGILLDIPTDKTLSPEFQKAVQATYSSADQAGAELPPQTSAVPEVATSAQTATQMAVERAG